MDIQGVDVTPAAPVVYLLYPILPQLRGLSGQVEDATADVVTDMATFALATHNVATLQHTTTSGGLHATTVTMATMGRCFGWTCCAYGCSAGRRHRPGSWLAHGLPDRSPCQSTPDSSSRTSSSGT